MHTIVSITQTSEACPSQWEGKTTNGDDVYIRFRHGILRLDINGKTEAEIEVSGDECDGYLDLGGAMSKLYGCIELTEEAEAAYYNYNCSTE